MELKPAAWGDLRLGSGLGSMRGAPVVGVRVQGTREGDGFRGGFRSIRDLCEQARYMLVTRGKDTHHMGDRGITQGTLAQGHRFELIDCVPIAQQPLCRSYSSVIQLYTRCDPMFLYDLRERGVMVKSVCGELFSKNRVRTC